MAGLAPLLLIRLSLSTCVLLLLAACPSLATAPCSESSDPKPYNTFKERHLPQGQPVGTDQNAWSTFIKANTDCKNRPIQSFLPPGTLDQVEAVCSSQGGKVYNKGKDNLCISQREFTFVTVKSDKDCNVKSVEEEKKNLILACNRVGNQCLPVHFEANPNGKKPNNNDADCTA